MDRTMQDAIAHAERWAREYGEARTVYHVTGPDRFGRLGVTYVRPPLDPEMEAFVAMGKAVTVHRAKGAGR